MSFASNLRPTNFPFNTVATGQPAGTPTNVPFHHDPDYLTLSRMLIRYQNSILLTPSPSVTDRPYDLTPLQQRIQAELWSPLPYHRTKWLHNIDGARNLLLKLERTALSIKVQRAKKEAIKDLAEKRALIKRLRNRVEEISRDVENMGDKAWDSRRTEDDELLGERIEDIIGKSNQGDDTRAKPSLTDDLVEGRPIKDVNEESKAGEDEDVQRAVLFGSSIRKRKDQQASNEPVSQSKGRTSGFSNLQSTERALADSSRTHEDLTTSLVSMAAQLKQQTRAFQFSLDQDKGLLDRALEGLDRNVSGMELASKNLAFLRRMSEGEGWWGRMKLYAFIFGMWVAAILLVFVGPKLRF